MSTQTVFVTAGATSKTVDVQLVQKAAATSPGDPLTALAFNTSSLTAYYRKGATGTATSITLATQTVGGAWSSGGFVEVSSTNAPGLYRFDVPDTVIATAGFASVTFNGAANLATHTVLFIITAIDLYDSVRAGMTALPNAAAAASNGLLISGSNSGTTTFGALTVTGATTFTGNVSAAAGITVTQSTTNGSGLSVTGNGTGAGILATGGATGIGISAVGGSTSGSAVKATGTAGNAIALELVGQGSAAGFKTTGGATGNGATFAGGSTSGHGLQATTVSSNEIDADITGTLSAVATGVQTAIAGKVWDEALSGHTTAGSFGSMLQTPDSGTAQAGGATTITLRSGASATTDYYKNSGVQILSGTGAGQFRFITAYNGSTKVATVSAWATNPDATSVYAIIPFGAIAGATAPTASENAIAVWDELRSSHTAAGTFGQWFQQVFRSNTAQAGSAGSITLDASASATNDLYKYAIISVIAGTGAGQSRQCNGYTGSSKVATVGVNWTVAPASDSVFMITPLGVDAATVAAIASAVWEETRAAHATAGTMGEFVTADAQRIGGNATAGTNAKNAFDGATGYGFINCTMPTTTNVTNRVTANTDQISGDATSGTNLKNALNGTGGVTISAALTGNITGNMTGNITGSLSGSVGSVTGDVGGSVGSVTTVSDKTGYSLSNAGIDALFTRQLTESYAADAAAPTVAQALMLIQQTLGDFSISGTTLTVKKVDGSTTAASFTLNDSSAPTAITRTG